MFVSHFNSLLKRLLFVFPLITSILLGLMCFRVANTHAQQQSSQAILSVRIDDLKSDQADLRQMLQTLALTVQDERDKLNQMQGMLIGFGGFACVLQILNTILQFRVAKKSEE